MTSTVFKPGEERNFLTLRSIEFQSSVGLHNLVYELYASAVVEMSGAIPPVFHVLMV